MTPLTPSATTSGTDPLRQAMTGVPADMDSIMTRPKGSGQSIGKSKRARLAEKFALLALIDLADEFDQRMIEHRFDHGLEIFEVDIVDFRGDAQFQP